MGMGSEVGLLLVMKHTDGKCEEGGEVEIEVYHVILSVVC